MSFLKLKYNKKLDYLVIFIILMMSVGANFFKNTTILRLPVLLFVIAVLYSRKISLNLGNFKLILIFHIFHAILIFAAFSINPVSSKQYLTYLSYYALLMISFYASRVMVDFWSRLIKTVYYLSIISLFFYTIQLVFPFQLFALMKSFENYPFIGTDNPEIANIFIFTLRIESAYNRNSGFGWEPGAYSILLVITLFIHLIRNKLKIDRIAVVFVVGILTTLSTGGYIGLIYIGLFYLVNQRSQIKKIIGILIALPLMYYVSTLEFMTEKIEEQLEEQSDILDREVTRSTGRFGSFILDVKDWQESPLIGKGINLFTRYEIDDVEKFHRVNGVSTYLLKFGIIGFLIMLLNYYLTAKLLCKTYKYKGAVFLAFVFVMLNFSHNLLTSPLFLLLQFYHFHTFPYTYEKRELYQMRLELLRKKETELTYLKISKTSERD